MGNENAEIRYLGDVQRLQLEPGDCIVLTVQGFVSEAMRHSVEETMDRALPGVRVLVLEEGTKIGVIGGLVPIGSEG